MDKKRRKKSYEKVNLHNITQLVSKNEKCGLINNIYNYKEPWAKGTYKSYSYDGLQIFIFDTIMQKDLAVENTFTESFLEMSFLIEGEKVIQVAGLEQDFLHESQESYLVFLSNIKTTTYFNKTHHLKEVKIRMNNSFIQKHQLNEELLFLNLHTLATKNFVQPINHTKQQLISKLLNDNHVGLTKRLLLESITLQLLSEQLNSFSNAGKPDNLLKKMYEVESLISSDLSVHYSIQELAKLVGLNDFLIKKEFKRIFGTSVFEYLIDLRMSKSKELLSLTDKPIYEIAELIGYKNPTHYTAAFKRKVGITPKKYREN